MEHSPPVHPEVLLDTETLAAYLGLSRKALYNSLHRHQLPTPIRIGNRLRWRWSDIEEWLDRQQAIEAEVRGQT